MTNSEEKYNSLCKENKAYSPLYQFLHRLRLTQTFSLKPKNIYGISLHFIFSKWSRCFTAFHKLNSSTMIPMTHETQNSSLSNHCSPKYGWLSLMKSVPRKQKNIHLTNLLTPYHLSWSQHHKTELKTYLEKDKLMLS